MSKMLILVDAADLTAAGLASVVDLAPGQLPALQNLNNYMESLAGGNQSADLNVKQGAEAASGTLTVASTGSSAGQACTVLNVTLTGRASSPAANEFVVSSTPATQASNMAAAINASTSLSSKVIASADGGVVTITALTPGALGNGLQLSAGNLSNVTAGAFAGGDNGDEFELSF